MASRWTELCVDCSDPERLSRFWCEVLGWREVGRDDEVIEIGAASGAQPTLTFVRVPQANPTNKRLQNDENPRGCDQDTQLHRLLAHGPRHGHKGHGHQTWLVRAHPQGNQ